jgi:hypothetical protein
LLRQTVSPVLHWSIVADGERAGILAIEAQPHVPAARAIGALVGRDVRPRVRFRVELPDGAIRDVVGADVVDVGDVQRRAVVGDLRLRRDQL